MASWYKKSSPVDSGDAVGDADVADVDAGGGTGGAAGDVGSATPS